MLAATKENEFSVISTQNLFLNSKAITGNEVSLQPEYTIC